MTITEFCLELAKKFNVSKTESLAGDFKWLVECGEINAEYGYGAAELLKSNATARELYESIHTDNMKDAILNCGRVGWAKCAEDMGYMQDMMRKALAV